MQDNKIPLCSAKGWFKTKKKFTVYPWLVRFYNSIKKLADGAEKYWRLGERIPAAVFAPSVCKGVR